MATTQIWLSRVLQPLGFGHAILNTLSVFVGFIIVSIVLTTSFTTVRFWFQSRGNAGRYENRPPITLPYRLPWIGGALQMGDPHALYERVRRLSPKEYPVKLRLGPVGIYFVFGIKSVSTIFRNSKALSKEFSNTWVFAGSGAKGNDLEIMSADTSGHDKIPATPIPEESRIWRKLHLNMVTHLSSGAAVSVLTQKFAAFFQGELDREKVGSETTVPLYDFLKHSMLKAGIEALAGTELFRTSPDFSKMFWDYDQKFLMLCIPLPKILNLDGHHKRDKILEATTKWVQSAHDNFDPNDINLDWEKNYGSAYFRSCLLDLKAQKLSAEGQAAAMLPLIWATNSNSIPGAGWILLEALQQPGLMARLHAEISTVATTSASGNLAFDIPKLLTLPLLHALYLETLRLRASVTVTRQLATDLQVGGYALQKGNMIMSPSWLPHTSAVWDVPGHAAGEFWAERFLQLPRVLGDKAFASAMRPESFFPYGGGSSICGGRHFAKQEILLAVALVVMKFDLALVAVLDKEGKECDGRVETSRGFEGAGIMPPGGDLMVKMKRR